MATLVLTESYPIAWIRSGRPLMQSREGAIVAPQRKLS